MNVMRHEPGDEVRDTETGKRYIVWDVITYRKKDGDYSVVWCEQVSNLESVVFDIDEFNSDRFVPVNHRPC